MKKNKQRRFVTSAGVQRPELEVEVEEDSVLGGSQNKDAEQKYPPGFSTPSHDSSPPPAPFIGVLVKNRWLEKPLTASAETG